MEKGNVAGKVPEMVDLQAGKPVAWCSCGRSANQPYCNGAHKDTTFTPVVFKPEEDVKAALCMCKQTANPPYCDGSHAQL